MAPPLLLKWLVTAGLLFAQGLFFYAIIRYMVLGRLRINPFQKGWRHLYERYRTSTGPALMELASVIVGAAGYPNSMYVSFAATGVFFTGSTTHSPQPR